MNTSIAEYFQDELYLWKSNIDIDLTAIEQLEDTLNHVLTLNTVPKLAAKVEHHLNTLHLCRQDLVPLSEKITAIEPLLNVEELPLENKAITADIINRQRELRELVHTRNKEFSEIRFAAEQFIAETIIAQAKLA